MKELEEKYYWVWFSLLEGIGIKRKQKLLEWYHHPKQIYCLTKEELQNKKGIGEMISNSIFDLEIKEKAKFHFKRMQEQKIEIVSIQDLDYPDLLKEIYDPPISLYVKGSKKCLKDCSIAIVGCREASAYGKKVASLFSYYLAKEKVTIVSGLARGIDSCSHFGAIQAKEKTIAVLGSGLDIIYPKENEKLANQIIQTGGAIVSEYPLETPPNKMNFPARNRIISGLSKGILVVEAKEKSGTLITVDFAIEQGREVFVIPGNINSVHSKGTNKLIKQGAIVVTTIKDILDEIKK